MTTNAAAPDPAETEKGFGTGLRAKMQRSQGVAQFRGAGGQPVHGEHAGPGGQHPRLVRYGDEEFDAERFRVARRAHGAKARLGAWPRATSTPSVAPTSLRTST